MTQDHVGTNQSADQPRIAGIRGKIAALGVPIEALKGERTGSNANRIAELDERYAELKSEFDSFVAEERIRADYGLDEQTSLERVKAQAQEAWTQTHQRVNRAHEDLKTFATDERNAAALRKSARDVGDDLTRAWSEVSTSFDNAMRRLRRNDARSGSAARPEPREQPLKKLNASPPRDQST